jgi:hypothetical protein
MENGRIYSDMEYAETRRNSLSRGARRQYAGNSLSGFYPVYNPSSKNFFDVMNKA